MPGGNNLINAKEVLERAGVASEMKVGDFGCGGMGYFTLTAAGLVGEDGRVYAVDILKTVLSGVLERAKARGLDNIKIVWSDLEVYGATKIEDASLDMGMLVNTLYQTEKDEAIIKECVRMIKPGGKLLVVDWNVSNTLNPSTSLGTGRAQISSNDSTGLGPVASDRVDKEEVKRVVSELGLRQVESFEAGRYHFALVFVK